MQQVTRMVSEERAFRCEILESALCNLPVNIIVNEQSGIYHVRDNTQMIIWADDLPHHGGKELFEDLACLIREKERGAFLNTFLQEIDEMAFRHRRILPKAYNLNTRKEDEESLVLFDLKMGSKGGNLVYEIKIETWL